jgi:tRNA A58 N-methylase Trm61
VRVALPTLEFDDDSRKAIRASAGKAGMATRAECVEFAENAVEVALENVEELYLENPVDELEDDEIEDDEIEGIPNADFEELEDDLRIVDHWI